MRSKIGGKRKGSCKVLAATAVLLLTAAAVAIYAGVLNDGKESSPRQITPYCGSAIIPDTVYYEPAQSYSTPYGSFEPIEHILEINEYMTLHPTINDFEACMGYIVNDGDEEEAKRAEARRVMERIRELSDDICEGLTSERDKAHALAMWTGLNLSYDFDAAESSSPQSEVTSLQAIIENDFKTTCGGFANFYSALCCCQGIYCLNLKGGTPAEGYSRAQLESAPANHEWNAVVADGRWYYSDCTWIADHEYKRSGLPGDGNTKPFYALFGFGEMSVEHRIDRSEQRCYLEAG